MTHITDYGGAIDDYYPKTMERIVDITEHERAADIEAESARMSAEALDGGWQPIETAPKNRKILVCQYENKIVETANGIDRHGNWKTGQSPMDFICGVTHWREIPEPPK